MAMGMNSLGHIAQSMVSKHGAQQGGRGNDRTLRTGGSGNDTISRPVSGGVGNDRVTLGGGPMGAMMGSAVQKGMARAALRNMAAQLNCQ